MLTSQVQAAISARRLHPAGVVVLLPYAQLMAEAQAAWLNCSANLADSLGPQAAFAPRFETSLNWAGRLHAFHGGFLPSGTDLRFDAAIDSLSAADLLRRAGVQTKGSSESSSENAALAADLLAATQSIARLAAAQEPSQRLAWGERCAAALGAAPCALDGVLAYESAISRIALAWAASSSYATDVLFSAEPDLLVVVDGFQQDPLAASLASHFADRSERVELHFPQSPGAVALHAALGGEDEAERSAACVLARLAQGLAPVALIAQDRLLTRRAVALLSARGVAVRDETGWTLSTTRASATVMALLRAAPGFADCDAVLDWLQAAPAFSGPALGRLEAQLRSDAVRLWRDVPSLPEANLPELQAAARQDLLLGVAELRRSLQAPRSIADWLKAVQTALQQAGQWAALVADSAGQAVLAALHLTTSADLPDAQEADAALLAATRLDLAGFTSWVGQALEAGSFSPPHPLAAQVVVLPLGQLLGREMQAVVLPGCDAQRLPVAPEPGLVWTPEQRLALGLPTRERLAAEASAIWQHALAQPHLDVLWRVSQDGQTLMPSGFVQLLELDIAQGAQRGVATVAADPRLRRKLSALPTPRPQPVGAALPISRLSAGAYEDLRRCPYRFFALRQLKLKEAQELDAGVDKRDLGLWLHHTLYCFHEALKNESNHAAAQSIPAMTAMINIAADEAKQHLNLQPDEFLPFAASWPRLRDGYLKWLLKHSAEGASYLAGEVKQDTAYGRITLTGTLDRIDAIAGDAHDAKARCVIDYKTEPPSRTQARIKQPQEDTQLAFYAALLTDDRVLASYVNVGELSGTKTYAQADVNLLRDGLIESILIDTTRIAGGATLPALGEGSACDYCAARGLCRKDFW